MNPPSPPSPPFTVANVTAFRNAILDYATWVTNRYQGIRATMVQDPIYGQYNRSLYSDNQQTVTDSDTAAQAALNGNPPDLDAAVFYLNMENICWQNMSGIVGRYDGQ